MGSSNSSGARDAYGNHLQEGDYVECTTDGVASSFTELGKVTAISSDHIKFEFPIFGTYVYNQDEIRQWGIRRVITDYGGSKLQVNQCVELWGGYEGIISAINETLVTVRLTSRDWNQTVRTLTQHDVKAARLQICGALRGTSRKCTPDGCL
mmetsp:Transcript_25593/g.64455  ORF Transcript_25593/g.64455 Transcript_25593/m.64455 type:complete len:152 (+) Transcript_25593:56-511(+)